ncbi:T53G5 protein, partial [Crypturellus undulatus]|nr:T53G5 protein [Crypturellus undulatus]
WQVLRELVLLRLLRRENRRVARLHALALRCWKALRARPAAVLQPTPGGCPVSPTREHDLLLECAEDTANSPVGDTECGATMDLGTAEASERDLLGALPQRVLMPAPKVLCRPSAQRWVKPCCTRSCSGSLGRALAARHPQ